MRAFLASTLLRTAVAMLCMGLLFGFLLGARTAPQIQMKRVEGQTGLDAVSIQKMVRSYDELIDYSTEQDAIRRNCSYDAACHAEWKRVQSQVRLARN